LNTGSQHAKKGSGDQEEIYSIEHYQNQIAAFIGVLGCSASEAEFFLESTTWDIETAVSLWLENHSGSNRANHG
jgi:hypothetical protein